MIIAGIDIGLTGAIATLGHKSELLGLDDMPVMQRGAGKAKVKNQVNPTELAALLHEHLKHHDKNEILVIIELVAAMPKQGVSTMLSLGHTAGIIEGVVATKGYPHRLVSPQAWKKAMKITANKEAGRAMAQRLYPQAVLNLMKHHNRAEAILLALYGQQTYA